MCTKIAGFATSLEELIPALLLTASFGVTTVAVPKKYPAKPIIANAVIAAFRDLGVNSANKFFSQGNIYLG
jgi:hypothetical protein